MCSTSHPRRATGHVAPGKHSGLEFTTVCDDSYGDERWIEIKPPNQDLLLALTLRRPDEPRATVPDRLPHSNLFFDCADIEQTHRQLSRRGMKFPLPPSNEQFGMEALAAHHDDTDW
jgi:hypothetical protein